MHSQHYMNFIDLCRKLVGRSTAYNLAIGLSHGLREDGFEEQEEQMLPFMQFLLFTKSYSNI